MEVFIQTQGSSCNVTFHFGIVVAKVLHGHFDRAAVKGIVMRVLHYIQVENGTVTAQIVTDQQKTFVFVTPPSTERTCWNYQLAWCCFKSFQDLKPKKDILSSHQNHIIVFVGHGRCLYQKELAYRILHVVNVEGF
jgi:hypothetical protein